MQLPKPSKSLWLLLSALAVVLGLWFGVILPGLNRTETKVQQILDTEDSLDNSATTLSNFINAKQAQPDLELARTELASVFINSANPVSFISRLEELATARNVAFDITVSNAIDDGNATVSQRPVKIIVTGPLEASLNFMNDIAVEPFALVVNQVNINATSGTVGTVTLTIDALTYWRL